MGHVGALETMQLCRIDVPPQYGWRGNDEYDNGPWLGPDSIRGYRVLAMCHDCLVCRE